MHAESVCSGDVDVERNADVERDVSDGATVTDVLIAKHCSACKRAMAVARGLRLDLSHSGELSHSAVEISAALCGVIVTLSGVVIDAPENHVLAVVRMCVASAHPTGSSLLAA
eukprot:COSAG02_NODE_369_length_23680_cov_36.650609_15_plen_113_part_00